MGQLGEETHDQFEIPEYVEIIMDQLNLRMPEFDRSMDNTARMYGWVPSVIESGFSLYLKMGGKSWK